MRKKQPLRIILIGILLVYVLQFLFAPASAFSTGYVEHGNMISLGEDGAAVVDGDGTLWTWGRNSYGELLVPETGNSYKSPTKAMENVASVCCGRYSIAVIKKNGELWMCGNNTYGQYTALETYTLIKIMDDVVAVSCGADHFGAIKSDGTLWMWGKNTCGQLGLGYSDDNIHEPEKVMDNVIAVSCGDVYTAVIKSDNSLWTWGQNKYGELGNGKTETISAPSKVMEDVSTVSCSEFHTAAVKTDGTLWTWGYNRNGELGNGTTENSNVPLKILNDVETVSCGGVFSDKGGYTAAVKTDGTLWTWGYNGDGQLGIGSHTSAYSPQKVMDGVFTVCCSSGVYLSTAHVGAIKTDGTVWTWGDGQYGKLGNGKAISSESPIQVFQIKINNSPENNEPNYSDTRMETEFDSYIYDTDESVDEIVLPSEWLNDVTDTSTAVEVVTDLADLMTDEQKAAPTSIDLATLFAETATAKAASRVIEGNDILIDASVITELGNVAAQTSVAVEVALKSGGVTTARYLSTTVTLVTDETDITVRVDPDVLTTEVDKVRVETPSYALTFKLSDLAPDLNRTLTFTAKSAVSGSTTPSATVSSFSSNADGQNFTTIFRSIVSNAAAPAVEIGMTGGKTTNSITVSLPSEGGDTTYRTVATSDGTATASKYNPATTMMDGKINTSGTYTVKSNEKDFTDIANKSAEMQKAIRYLASKGIINGTTPTTFSPDGSINRAEIATLLVKALGKLDSTATASFSDVTKGNWFYTAAASSQRHKLINGYEDNTFRGTTNINKVQIVAVSSRVLTSEMNYKTPSNPSSYLGKYSDSIAAWAQSEVALATKENLVVYRTDGTFSGDKTMTRGDAAIIIYRLFQRIW